MELEIEYRRAGATSGLDKYYLHVRCFAVWECEIGLADGTISSNGPVSESSSRLLAAPSESD
jgi:hypothetical protein